MTLTELEARVQHLEMVVDNLEKYIREIDNRTIGSKTFGTSTPFMPSPPPGHNFQFSTKCSKCGIELNRVMSYSCPHSDCPCGMGPITCKV